MSKLSKSQKSCIAILCAGLLVAGLGTTITYKAVYNYNTRDSGKFLHIDVVPGTMTTVYGVELKALMAYSKQAEEKAHDMATIPFGTGAALTLGSAIGLLTQRRK